MRRRSYSLYRNTYFGNLISLESRILDSAIGRTVLSLLWNINRFTVLKVIDWLWLVLLEVNEEVPRRGVVGVVGVRGVVELLPLFVVAGVVVEFVGDVLVVTTLDDLSLCAVVLGVLGFVVFFEIVSLELIRRIFGACGVV